MPSRILIADDHDLMRHLIKQEFEDHADWVCIEAVNGQQAVVKATELKPEIIILDLMMPVMDGLTAAREIAKILPAVPIVIHTVHFCEQVKWEAKKIGVREVLPKADIASLVGVVEALLGEGSRIPEPKPALSVAMAASVSASRPPPPASAPASDGAALFHFGVLSSSMHVAWMHQDCGRLKSEYRYSNQLVYNNYPWPEAPSAKQRAAVETAAQGVFDARKEFPDATLADLYNPLTMPSGLVKAHAELDHAVDLCYRSMSFQNDRQRVEHLFVLYEKLTAPLIVPAKKSRRKSTEVRTRLKPDAAL
jgi:DNA-binding NarL/FixJ family response regulator